MKVFVTGGSGLLGGALIPQLVSHGHHVVALSRSTTADAKLSRRGATPIRGDQTSLDVLAEQARQADAVIHAAFGMDDMTDPNWYTVACEQDRAAIKAMCDELVHRQNTVFVYTSGTLAAGGSDEDDKSLRPVPLPRAESETLTDEYSKKGLRAYIVRIPPINHGPGHRHQFITVRVDAAEKHGYAGYVGDGDQQWPSCHVDDAADIYVRAIESDVPSGTVFHAVSEHVTMKEVAEFIGKKLDVPTQSVKTENAMEHWGFTGMVLGMHDITTSDKTQARLGWKPTGYGLFQELEGYDY